MKSAFRNIVLLSFCILFMTGCKKNYVISERQKVLFHYEYVNYAWGYQHSGFIIDNEGNVLIYENPENWNFLDDNHSISEAQIAENISKCRISGKKIPQEDLQKYTNYIKNIASSQVTALKNVAADAGSHEYFCYQYSESSQTYKCYLIKMEGDFTCENLNFYTKKIVTWMKEINSSLQFN
jgi:hypothetical protein